MSTKDHEVWYGDRRVADEMEKEDLVKNMHFKLKMLNIGTSGIGGFDVNYKNL